MLLVCSSRACLLAAFFVRHDMQPSSYCEERQLYNTSETTLEWKACLIGKISHSARVLFLLTLSYIVCFFTSEPPEFISPKSIRGFLRGLQRTLLAHTTMYQPIGDFADFAHDSPHHSLDSYITIVSGGNKYQFRLSAIHSQLPGLFKAVRRDRGHRKKDRKQFDVVDVINSRFNPSRDVSYIIECAQTILDHVHQLDAGVIPTALFRLLDSYLRRHGTHDDRLHDWKALVKRFAILGKLLDPRVLGCGRDLFDDFSGWFIMHLHTIVKSMPMDAVLDFIHAFERTRRPFTHVLEAMIDNIDSRVENELLYFESKPTYLRSVISARTMHRIHKIIQSNIEGLRIRNRRRLPDPRDWSKDVLIRPGLPSPRHSSHSSRDLVPRVHGPELVSGDEFCRDMLHDLVDFEPERILVQDSHSRPSGRSLIRHGRAHHDVGNGFMACDDDDFSYTDSDSDYNDYPPSPYEYDDHGVGGIVVPPCLMSPYPEPDRFGDGLFDIYDDIVHVPRPVPVMV